MTTQNALMSYVQPNALLPLPSPEQRLEQEIKRLGQQFGADTVKAAVKVAFRKKVGRKTEKDWSIIGPEICNADARAWLNGIMPRDRLSNSQIAKDFANRFPGHEYTSTFQRVMRKLGKQRIYFCLIHAIDIAEKENPVSKFLDALDALILHDPALEKRAWGAIRFYAIKDIEDYELRFGALPNDLSIDDLRIKLMEARDSNVLLGSGNNVLARYAGMFAPQRKGG